MFPRLTAVRYALYVVRRIYLKYVNPDLVYNLYARNVENLSNSESLDVKW